MYEEIIQRLRETSMDFGEADHVSVMLLEAADVIEEEDMNFRHLERDYKDLCRYLPKWIPATERLPEEAYACLAIVWDNNPYSGDTFLNYYPEFVGYGGGSWNDYNGDEIPLDVVYWMKLPQIPGLPKEET